MTKHTVYHAINHPLTFAGVDRRLWMLAVVLTVVTFQLFKNLPVSLLVLVAMYVFGLWATKRDPEMIRILLMSSRYRDRYDPAKCLTSREN